VCKITDALGYVWEYTYTSYGDVKSVKDPEGGVVQYVYDYDLGEPAYGQVRKVIDALGRATEYQYYAANDSNPARRGQVRRVEVPGGYWRAMDYGSAGWLVRREVQVANGSEVTVYTYDAWGRLRAIDYPRSADVRMGWDGENRRVRVQDGAGRREYSYDAWGRVVRQEGCCGDEIGIVAVEARYDGTAVDEWGNPEGVPVFGYEYRYDLLGRVVWSREQPSGDETVYDYSPAGRLIYESRGGDVSYMRIYRYHVDGSRQWVWRVDGRYGERFDWYSDDPVSGRLTDVVDQVTGVKHRFAWNPEGTLARWEEAGSYARVFGYDEEGRLVKIERDYGGGDVRLAYEYGSLASS
jgi:YD repeat-containing protein